MIKADHGIRNIIIDLAEMYPKASFSSFLVKTAASSDELEKLEQSLETFCQNKSCLIVGSVDFSHYNPSSIAELHDQFSIKSLNSDDSKLVTEAETDSPEILGLLKKMATARSLYGFDVYENSNSGKMGNNLETETTSWVIGNFSKNQKNTTSTELLFAGDIMMDRLINHRFKSNFESIFDDFKDRVFSGVDTSIANLEGPVSDGEVDDDISVNNLVFNFPFSSLGALKFVKLDGFSLANNHTLNDGSSGLSRTRDLLEKNNFFSFGSPNKVDEFSLKRLEDEQKTSLIGVNLLEKVDNQELVNLIKEEKASGRFVIVYPHWGNEYQTSHSSRQEESAHMMIDAGADLIIGSHPHVVQDSELYKGKLVFYSLGNFIFDQTFSKETQRGLLVGVKIDQRQVRVNLVPVESVNLKPRISKGESRQELIKRATPKEFLSQVQSGIIETNR